ncbi:hypothetical protein BC938DRAFT_473107 [Jimgerdemannia flammicorona]|uniref:Methyltransferase domain-containing protein n=1 Tax=Jimgerdemannia flammicorona TaxID=994334 RepID=A0A433QTH9_9FUNG|nr:hypothetical protein BC938DRAFT_473107 [Jimgerdemannia flammicorona]
MPPVRSASRMWARLLSFFRSRFRAGDMGQTSSNISFRVRRLRRRTPRPPEQDSSLADNDRPVARDDSASFQAFNKDLHDAVAGDTPNFGWQETSQTQRMQKQYIWPPGETERERMQTQHQILKMAFGGRSHFGPTEQFPPGAKILDVGRGEMFWMLDMAAEFPEAELHVVDFVGAYTHTDLPSNIQIHTCDGKGVFNSHCFRFARRKIHKNR